MRPRSLLLALALASLPSTARAAAPPTSGELRRLALLVGANDGGADRVKLKFAGSDAQAVARVLSKLGGLRASDEILLLEPSRAGILSALVDLGHRVEAARKEQRRTEVIVYYSGHSDEQGLLPGGERLGYSELRAAIDRLGADVRIAILDSCSAGAFTRRKGGLFRPPFLVDDSIQVRGHAFLASSSANEAAQESDRIRGSFFTHYLVTGLRGAADVSGDGRITLNEAYTFAFQQTLAGTEKTLGGAQHPAYDIEMAGTGDVVMTDLHEVTAGLTLPGTIAGRVFVRDSGGALVAELGKGAGGTVELGLDPGDYKVVLDQGGKLLQGEVHLLAGRSIVLELPMLTGARIERTVRRGDGPARDVAFNLALVHPLATNALFGEPVRNRFSLGLLAGYGDGLAGMAVGGLLTGVRHDSRGLVVSGLGSWSGGDLVGVAASGVVTVVGGSATGFINSGVANVVRRNFAGLTAAGVTNVLTGEARGLLASGVVNVVTGEARGMAVTGVANVTGDFEGLQVSGVANVSGDLSGAQVGLVNYAREVRGLQLGLVNIADSVKSGAPIGLISIVRHGGTHSLELAMTDAMPLNLLLKLGARHVYTVLGAGLDPFRTTTTAWSVTAGLGLEKEWDRWYLEGDLITTAVQTDIQQLREGTHLSNELRLMVGYRILPQLAVFLGPSVHVSVTDEGGRSLSALSGLEKEWLVGGSAVRLGPGFALGVRAF